MNQKIYFTITGLIFFVIATTHLSRLITRWDMVLAGWDVPHWVSIPGAIVTGILSVWGFNLAGRAGNRRTYHM